MGTQIYLNPLFDLERNDCPLSLHPSAGSIFSEASAGQHFAQCPDASETTAVE